MKTCCGYSLEAPQRNLCFRQEITKLFSWYPLSSRPMCCLACDLHSNNRVKPGRSDTLAKKSQNWSTKLGPAEINSKIPSRSGLHPASDDNQQMTFKASFSNCSLKKKIVILILLELFHIEDHSEETAIAHLWEKLERIKKMSSACCRLLQGQGYTK